MVANSTKMKLLSFLACQSSEREDKENSYFYRDIFRKAVKRVIVMFRIYKAIRDYATEKNMFLFYENAESKLYRKFLNNWSNYWQKKQDCKLRLDEKLRRHNKVYFAKTKKYVACTEEDDGDDLLTAVKRMRDKRKSESLGKWVNLV